MSIHFTEQDFVTEHGRTKVARILTNLIQWQDGVNAQLAHLVKANQDKLIAAGHAYAKPENLDA